MVFRQGLVSLGAATALLLSSSCSEGSARTQDDTAHAHTGGDGPAPIVVTHFTDKVQLFMEYPRLVRGEEARFLAHVTVLDTGDPVRSGRLELQLSQPDGTVISVVAAEPARAREILGLPAGN